MNRANQIESDYEALVKYEKAIKTSNDSTEVFNNTLLGASQSAQGYAEKIKNNVGSAEAYRKSQIDISGGLQKVSLSAKAASIGMKALNVAMNMGAMLLVSVAIGAIAKAVDNYVHANERAIEAGNELSAKYEETQNTISKNIETVKGLRDEFDDLSKGVDDNGKNIALSAEQYARYKEIVKQITDISPNVVKGYNDERDAILDKNKAISETIASLEKQQKLELLEKTTPENLKTAAKEAYATFDEYNKELKNSKNSITQSLIDSIFNANAVDENGIKDITGEVYKQIVAALDLDEGKIVDQSTTFMGLLAQMLSDSENLQKAISNSSKLSTIIKPEAFSAITNSIVLYTEKASQAEMASKGFSDELLEVMQSTDGFSELSTEAQAFAQTYANSFAMVDGINIDEMVSKWPDLARSIVLALKDAQPEVQKAFSDLGDLTNKKGLINPVALNKQVDEAINIIASGIEAKNPEIKFDRVQFKLDSGFDESLSTIAAEIEKKVKDQELKSYLTSSLTGEQLEQLVIKYSIEQVGKWSIDDAKKAVSSLSNDIDEISENPIELKIGDIQADVSKVESAFDKIQKLKQGFVDDGSLDTGSISGLFEAFKDTNVDIEAYVQAISKAGTSVSEFSAQTDKLVTQMLQESDLVRNVNTGTSEYIIQTLQSRGVTNARAIVTAQLTYNLTQQKIQEYEAANGAIAFGNAESMNIEALMAVAKQLGLSKAALFDYVLQKINANAVTISTDGDVSNVMALAQACGVGAEAVSKFMKAKQMALHFESLSSSAMSDYGSELGSIVQQDFNAQADHYANLASNLSTQISSSIKNASFGGNSANYSPKLSNSGSKGGSGSSTDAWKEEFQKYYDELKYLREQDKIDDQEYYNRLTALNDKYFKGREKYITEYRQYDTELYNLQKTLSAKRITDMEHELQTMQFMNASRESQIAVHKKIQDELHRQANIARARGLKENDEYIQSLQSKWQSAAKSIADIQKSIYEDYLKDAENYIEDRNLYEDWKKRGDSESKAIKRIMANVKKYYSQGIVDYETYAEKMRELSSDLYSALKDETQSFYEGVRDYVESQIDDEIEALQKKLEDQNDAYDEKIDILQKQKDTISEAREEEEKLLSIEKARIALAKAESNRNVQTYQRGIGFTWQSDPEAIKSAQDDLNDALKEYNQYKEDLALDKHIQSLEDAKEANEKSVNAQIEKLEDLKDEWSKALDISDDVAEYKKYLDKMLNFDNASYEDRLAAAKKFALEYSKTMQGLQTQVEEQLPQVNGVTYDKNVDYAAQIANAKASGAPDYVIADLEAKRQAKIVGENLNNDGTKKSTSSSSSSSSSSKPSSGSTVSSAVQAGASVGGGLGGMIGGAIGAIISTITNKHATGTLSAPGGLSLVGERGMEMRVLNQGDGIIPHDATKNLMAWGKHSPYALLDKIRTMSMPNIQLATPSGHVQSVSFNGDINLEYSGDDVSVFARKITTQLPSAMIQELNKRK